MSYNSDNNLRRKLIGLILLGLAVRVVMPAGYMPAPIGEGGPFVLCPGSLSGTSLILAPQAQAGVHHGDKHDPASGDASHFWEVCPFGVAFGSAVIETDTAFVSPEPGHALVSARPQLLIRRTASHAFHARAPPSLTSRYA